MFDSPLRAWSPPQKEWDQDHILEKARWRCILLDWTCRCLTDTRRPEVIIERESAVASHWEPKKLSTTTAVFLRGIESLAGLLVASGHLTGSNIMRQEI